MAWNEAAGRSTWDQYITEIKNQFDYLAAWPPGNQVKIGDVGLMDHNRFWRLTTLDTLGIRLETRADDSRQTLKYATKASVTCAFKASGRAPVAGSVLTNAEAGFTVEFAGQNALLFEALGCSKESVLDQPGLGDQLLGLYRGGRWNKAWHVVLEVMHADSASVLISSSSNSKLELAAKGDLATTISIADATAQLQVVYSRDMQTSIVAERGLTPLYRAKTIDDYIRASDIPLGLAPLALPLDYSLNVSDILAPSQL